MNFSFLPGKHVRRSGSSLASRSIAVSDSLRLHLLREVRRFVQSASQLKGVTRLALIGSLVTEKNTPKDADVLVTIDETVDICSLAALGRKLKGRAQSRGSGADVFLCASIGEYLGRTCSYKDCHPRMACLGRQCGRGTRICDDLENVHLDAKIVSDPPLELWPAIVKRACVPGDVASILINELSLDRRRT